MKTYQPKQKDVKRNWHLLDARGQVLGRFATEVARYLMGKHKPSYSNHMDMGDYVVVINAKEIRLTGRKREQKRYFQHSGFPGGMKVLKFSEVFTKKPQKVIEHAVSGMLPDNKLKQKRLKRLKVFANDIHPFKDKFKN